MATEAELNDAFPPVDPGVSPYGNKVVVQIRTSKKRSAGGIILAQETKETDQWNTQVAKVVAIGPIAFCNRTTGEKWPEGMWAKIGDFVRCPRWGGDRWEREVKDSEDKALFVTFNDHELTGRVTADPLKFKSYIL